MLQKNQSWKIAIRIILSLTVVCFLLTATSCNSSDSDNNIVLNSNSFSVAFDNKGILTSLKDVINNQEYLAKEVKAPILTLVLKDSTKIVPKKMLDDKSSGVITLFYEQDFNVNINYKVKKSYIKFEVVGVNNLDKLAGIIWGAYPTIITETIGEVVGVVRNDDFAIGLQALNPETTGGVPVTNAGYVPNRKGPAFKTDYGSALQAFAINRTRERSVDVWNGRLKDMPIPAVNFETIVGSKIALFGCLTEEVLATIGGIEQEEGLPHPTINGEWVKTHPERSKAYFITSFGEDNFDELLDYVKMAGMNSIYHSHPFENWGKFGLIPQLFPNGYKGMRKLVEKAKTQGIRVGAHTLTTFITPNDPFITPVPNKNLAKTGFGELTADIDEKATEIPINKRQYFDQEDFNLMHTIQIGEELIRYRAVSETTPFKLLDCERGAFGTNIAAHTKGEQVGKLLDHPYKVFFPNFELQNEMAQNLVRFLNETGVSHIDFDGHEGALATGQGTYGMDDFAMKVYNETDFELVNGSSRTTHFYWHMNHYINWGEPWYGKFRESQSDYRFNNQQFLEDNYLPNMLGWFSLTPSTSIEDIEWMLAKGAGYNAGFALSAKYEALKGNPDTEKILGAIRNWERARLGNAFSSKQREDFKDIYKEFQLKEVSNDEWKLTSFQNYDFEFSKIELQPGQPTYSEWKFNNENKEQPLRFKISLEGEGAISKISLEVVNYTTLNILETLKEGEEIILDQNGKLTHYNNKGGIIREKKITNVPIVGSGSQSLLFDCEIESGSPKVKLRLTVQGNEEVVKVK